MRIDHYLVEKGLAPTRSQAESFIALRLVFCNGKVVSKNGLWVRDTDRVLVRRHEQYVSRAGLKLSSVAKQFGLNFNDKVVLDVGSSTGGFTDYALRHGARNVIAVDVGTNQLHPTLRGDQRVTLYEQTDIRDVTLSVDANVATSSAVITAPPDIVLIDVSFISLREVHPHIQSLCAATSQIVAMCKPQFEAGDAAKHKGVIKNDRMRREILHSLELWFVQHNFSINKKADSGVAGMKGNIERFYLLKTTKKNSLSI